MHPAALTEQALLSQCTIRRGRKSGPGGQHRNKVETLIEITHTPSGIAAQAGERRSQSENRSVAIRRLRLALALGVRTPVPSGDRISPLWRSRLQRAAPGSRALPRIACSTRHDDFPTLLAEALDMLQACDSDPSKAGARLDCSPSSLVRLIKDHPPALALLNSWRNERGLHALQ
jgi:hypothetical protein